MKREGRSFDVVVIGGGTAGLTAALAARHEGAAVALVEREERIGGDCTFTGCVPSKALLEVARQVADARSLAARGILESEPHVRVSRALDRQREVVASIAHDERDERFLDAGIEVLHGAARFTEPGRVVVDGADGEVALTGRRFVIATGSQVAVPPIPGLAESGYLTHRTVFDLVDGPARLLVLGAGATGLELAQALARLGSAVTVIDSAPRILPSHRPEVSYLVAAALRRDGVELVLGAPVCGVRRVDATILVEVAGAQHEGDALLVATGRRASTEGLGLEHVAVSLRDGWIVVDRRQRTSAAHVFAAGDVTGGRLLTHIAAHEGRIAGQGAAGKRARSDLRVIPEVVYLDPEVARVGLSGDEALARQGSSAVRIIDLPLDRVDRARIDGRTDGFVRLVTGRRRVLGWTGGGRLLGAEVVARGAGELIHECALAMQVDAFAGRLAQTLHAYPTASVGLQQAASRLFPLGRALVEVDERPAPPASGA